MIVEDEKDLCLLLDRLLKKQYQSILQTHTLADARQKIHQFVPHILLLDYNLPDGKGTDIIETLKGEIPFLKVVMMSAKNSSHDVKRAYSKGADYFLPKPFSPETLFATLTSISGS